MLTFKEMLVSSVVMSLLACAGGEEKRILSRFFMACQSGDNATVAAFSQASFPEICESWEILEIGSETSKPFRLRELRGNLAEATMERDAQYERGKYFLENNYDSIEEIQTQLDRNPDCEFKGKLREVQLNWKKTVQERKDLERKVQDLKREMDSHAKLAEMSLMNELSINRLVGNVASKEVLVKTQVESEEKLYQFTLQKYNLTEEGSNQTVRSRWIIVGIEKQAT